MDEIKTDDLGNVFLTDHPNKDDCDVFMIWLCIISLTPTWTIIFLIVTLMLNLCSVDNNFSMSAPGRGLMETVSLTEDPMLSLQIPLSSESPMMCVVLWSMLVIRCLRVLWGCCCCYWVLTPWLFTCSISDVWGDCWILVVVVVVSVIHVV